MHATFLPPSTPASPPAAPVDKDVLLGCRQRAQLFEVAQPLVDNRALERDEHKEREQGIVPLMARAARGAKGGSLSSAH